MQNVGGPWAHAAGMKNVHAGGAGAGAAAAAAAAAGFFGRHSGPMGPESVRMLLADPERSKILISNLLAERTREVRVFERDCQGLSERDRERERERDGHRDEDREKIKKTPPVLSLQLFHTAIYKWCSWFIRGSQVSQDEAPEALCPARASLGCQMG